MLRRSAGAILVLVAAGGLVFWRESRRPAPTHGQSSGPARTTVVLFADLSEVDEAQGCGAIIRSVREAGRRGVATQEIDARSESAAAERYRLLVAPAVIVLDAAGREVARYEGESPKMVGAIRTELENLVGPR